MARNYSAKYKKNVNSLSAKEFVGVLLEITHPVLTEAARIVNDNDDFPYGEAHAFKAGHAYAVDDIVIPEKYNGRFYKVTAASGASGGSEPTWPTVLTNTVVSGGVTFRCEGYQYRSVGFDITMPDDKAKQLPRARLVIDNVNKELAPFLELSNGGEGTQVRVMEVLRSDPDTIEWETTLDLANIGMKNRTMVGDLGYEDLTGRNAVSLQYRPDTSPGLF